MVKPPHPKERERERESQYIHKPQAQFYVVLIINCLKCSGKWCAQGPENCSNSSENHMNLQLRPKLENILFLILKH